MNTCVFLRRPDVPVFWPSMGLVGTAVTLSAATGAARRATPRGARAALKAGAAWRRRATPLPLRSCVRGAATDAVVIARACILPARNTWVCASKRDGRRCFARQSTGGHAIARGRRATCRNARVSVLAVGAISPFTALARLSALSALSA